MLFESLRAGSFLCWFTHETQASLPASLPAQPPLFHSTAAQPSLWLAFSPSLGLSFLSQLPCPSLLPQKAPESALGLWSFQPPLTLPVIAVPPCLPACLCISLSSQGPPGWPCAVQRGPLLSPPRGGRGEHGAGGARPEAGDHGEAGRGKARTRAQSHASWAWVTLLRSRAASFGPQPWAPQPMARHGGGLTLATCASSPSSLCPGKQDCPLCVGLSEHMDVHTCTSAGCAWMSDRAVTV